MKNLFAKRSDKNKNLPVLDESAEIPVYLPGFGLPSGLRALAPAYVRWIDSAAGQPLPEPPAAINRLTTPAPVGGAGHTDGCAMPGAGKPGVVKRIKRVNPCMDD